MAPPPTERLLGCCSRCRGLRKSTFRPSDGRNGGCIAEADECSIAPETTGRNIKKTRCSCSYPDVERDEPRPSAHATPPPSTRLRRACKRLGNEERHDEGGVGADFYRVRGRANLMATKERARWALDMQAVARTRGRPYAAPQLWAERKRRRHCRFVHTPYRGSDFGL
eukprot:scaffold147790_cov29-Tisochrysis_lutea.AAC.1